MSHQSIHADTPRVVYLYEDVPKEALKSASARLRGSNASRFATPSSTRARTTTNGSSSEESSFVYPGNDLSANIEKADGFYDSTWRPLNAGEDVGTMTGDKNKEVGSSNAIPLSSNHNRTSSWITMDSDGQPAQASTTSSAYTPTPSYHSPSPSPSPLPQALPSQTPLANSISQPAPAAEAEDPWAAWTSSNNKATGEDAYLSRKSISAGKGVLPSTSSPGPGKTGAQASIHAGGATASADRGSAGRGRGRGKADLSIKGSSANRARSPVQTFNEPLPAPASETITSPQVSVPPSSNVSQSTTVTVEEDPWAAWTPASDAVTGQAARKARELATKAGKAVVESNIAKPPPIPAPLEVKPSVALAARIANGNRSLETMTGTSPENQCHVEVTAPRVVSGWTTIEPDAPSANLPSPRRQPSLLSIVPAEAAGGMPIASEYGIRSVSDGSPPVHDSFSHLTLNSKEFAESHDRPMSKNEIKDRKSELLVDLGETETHPPIPPLPSDRQKLQDSPTSSFASFHSIEDDGMANIPVLKPSSSSSQMTAQQNGGSSSPAKPDIVTVADDRQVLETKLRDLRYTGTDVAAIAGLLCSLPKSNLKKCLADTAFLKRKAEEAMRILQADDEDEEEL